MYGPVSGQRSAVSGQLTSGQRSAVSGQKCINKQAGADLYGTAPSLAYGILIHLRIHICIRIRIRIRIHIRNRLAYGILERARKGRLPLVY